MKVPQRWRVASRAAGLRARQRRACKPADGAAPAPAPGAARRRAPRAASAAPPPARANLTFIWEIVSYEQVVIGVEHIINNTHSVIIVIMRYMPKSPQVPDPYVIGV